MDLEDMHEVIGLLKSEKFVKLYINFTDFIYVFSPLTQFSESVPDYMCSNVSVHNIYFIHSWQKDNLFAGSYVSS